MACAARGVAVGAHPSLPDLQGPQAFVSLRFKDIGARGHGVEQRVGAVGRGEAGEEVGQHVEATGVGDASALQQYPRRLDDAFGQYFKVGRLFARVIGRPTVMRELTRLGMHKRFAPTTKVTRNDAMNGGTSCSQRRKAAFDNPINLGVGKCCLNIHHRRHGMHHIAQR